MKRLNLILTTLVIIGLTVTGLQAGRAINADLQIVMTSDTDVLQPGESVKYSIEAKNLGPDQASNVTATMTLISSAALQLFEILSLESDGWSCEQNAEEDRLVIGCTRGALDANSMTTIDLQVRAASDMDRANLSLIAQINSDTPDDSEENNDDSINLSITDRIADLAVSISGDQAIVRSGDVLRYQISSENLGPDRADSVEILLDLPDGAVLSAAQGDGWSCTLSDSLSNSLICLRETLEVGEEAMLSITATAPAMGEELPVNVSVSYDGFDPDVVNNVAFYDLALINEQGDLALAMSSTQAFILPGQPFSYAITIMNTGAEEATLVRVEAEMPVGFSLVEAGGESWSCSQLVDASVEKLICSREALSTGASSEISITMLAPLSEAEESVALFATANSDTFDPKSENNLASLLLPWAGENADLEVVAIESQEIIKAGDVVQYSITLQNHGPDDASDLLLRSVLPSVAQMVQFSAEGWICSSNTSDYTPTECTRDALASGEKSVLLLEYRFAEPAQLAEIAHTVELTATTLDPLIENNSSRIAQLIVTASADLEFSMTSDGDWALLNQPVTFTAVVENQGPDDAQGLYLEISAPNGGTEIISATGAGWECDVLRAEARATCSLSALSAGMRSEISLTALANEDFDAASLILSGSVATDTYDSLSLNNSTYFDLLVIQKSADLAISQEIEVSTDGKNLNFALEIANSGPDEALDIALVISLSAAVSIENLSQTGWQCEIVRDESSALECTLSRLVPNDVSTLSFEVVTDADQVQRDFRSSVVITSSIFDPDLSNNSILASTQVP